MQPRKHQRLYETIFEADTTAGKVFDVALLLLILTSVVALMLESVEEIEQQYGFELRCVEWSLTAIFTLEYLLRLYCVRRPMRYAKSFFGIVDLLAVLPTYLSLLLPTIQSLSVVRIMRIVRVFRVLKLAQFLGEAHILGAALRGSARKIIVFLVGVGSLVIVVGALMYWVEGLENDQFSSIPASVYWAIVTVTTVGYGDIAPESPLGRGLAAVLMIIGYGIFAVPTGIFASELITQPQADVSTQVCPECLKEGHAPKAVHCQHCGAELNPEPPAESS